VKPNKSSRSWSLRIKDILGSITKIEQYTQNMTLAEFKKNELVIDAVVRNFEINGFSKCSTLKKCVGTATSLAPIT
jgi:uncharacterized protein with HEPN domain